MEFVRLKRTNYARSRLQIFVEKPTKVFRQFEAPTALVSRGRKAAFLDNQTNQSVGTLVDNPGQRTPEFAPDILRHPGELGV